MRPDGAAAPVDPRWSFTTEVSVALLEVPTHKHGPNGPAYVAYNDVVRVVKAVEKRRNEGGTQ